MTKPVPFRQRFAEVLADLQDQGIKDGEAMALLGSLAADLALKLGQTSWSGAKAVMSAEQFDELLTSFRLRGNDMQGAGQTKHAYAIQALAVSLVARTQRQEPDMEAGEKLLDALIDRTVALTLAGMKPN